eukprot:2841996-Rhodomonas_salina.3
MPNSSGVQTIVCVLQFGVLFNLSGSNCLKLNVCLTWQDPTPPCRWARTYKWEYSNASDQQLYPGTRGKSDEQLKIANTSSNKFSN